MIILRRTIKTQRQKFSLYAGNMVGFGNYLMPILRDRGVLYVLR